MIRITVEESGIQRIYEAKNSSQDHVRVTMLRRSRYAQYLRDTEVISMEIDRETFIAETEKLLEEIRGES